MADPVKADIIKKYPIEGALNSFRKSLSSTCAELGVSGSSDEVQRLSDKVLKNLATELFWELQKLPTAEHLPSPNGRPHLRADLLQFIPLAISDDFDARSVIPLLVTVGKSDEAIWLKFYELATESTPPSRPLPYPYQTPVSFNTGSMFNTSENRKLFDDALKNELGSSLYIDVPGFFDTFFGEVANLMAVADTVFRKCQEGQRPLYNEEEGGWRDWPEDAMEEQVLKWLKEQVDVFLELAKASGPIPNVHRKLVGQPSKPLSTSTGQRKLDVGFANNSGNSECLRYDWSQILVPGELKSNPNVDRYSSTWLDLARYAREVLTTQDTRRFVLGFTLCGPAMRLWEFDRLGGIASSSFNINSDGLQFVSAILGYLWMNDEQLGFDPTITEMNGKRYMRITRNGNTERLVIDKVMKRYSSVVGRATTCWKTHREGDEFNQTLVVKDSWQYPERDEEGELLREATEKGVINVARYYHHETVHVGEKEDDINNNVRRGLDITKASNAFRAAATARKTEGKMPLPDTPGVSVGILPRNKKRSSNSLNESLPLSKRTCSSSPHKERANLNRLNRVHRRVILRDYGKNIHKASSRVTMLAALEGTIAGHQSLREQTGIIQSDVSIGNLMMNEQKDNLSWKSFLIDLDLGIREQRENPSGAPNKTGTKAFMAIEALYGEKRTVMHDLESFFWVLFWICIHYVGPNGDSREVKRFEKWNYADTEELAGIKLGIVSEERRFMKAITEHFTSYFRPLIPWVNRLRKSVFPDDKTREKEDPELYSKMREVLRKSLEDPYVKADWTG